MCVQLLSHVQLFATPWTVAFQVLQSMEYWYRLLFPPSEDLPDPGIEPISPVSIHRQWIRKLWYIYTMEYYSAIKKNIFESVLMRWMKLKPIIQSEVSQKEKHQYSILTHIYGI